MRELKYLVACSVDGFIAQTDGSISGFLTGGEHLAEAVKLFPETIPTHLRAVLGAGDANPNFDTVLMGRNTYAVGIEAGVSNPYGHLRQFVFSLSLHQSPDPNVTLVNTEPLTFVQRLKAESGKDIWLCGGGKLAAALLPEIDELILKVNPFLMGAGISLFAGHVGPIPLKLVSQKAYPNSAQLCRYRPA